MDRNFAIFGISLFATALVTYAFTTGQNQQLFAATGQTKVQTRPLVATPWQPSALQPRQGPFVVNAVHPKVVSINERNQSSFSHLLLAAAPVIAMVAAFFALAKRITRPMSTPQQWTLASLPLEEDYPGPGNPEDEFEVRVVWGGEEKTLKIKGDQSILMACEEAGLEVPYLCRNGVCLDCTAKIVEGIENARKDSQCHNADNIRNGYVCTCSTYVGGNGMKLLLGMQQEAYKAQFGRFEEEEKARLEKKKSIFG